jgi:O-antigen/teichoic acid export membrane protein
MKVFRKKVYHLSKKIGNKFDFDLPYFVENGFWVSANQIVQVLIGLGLSVVLARFTSTEVLGQYNFLLSILSILSIISMPGVNISLFRAIAKKKHGTYKKVVNFSFLWSLAGVPLFLFIAMYYYFEGNNLLSISIFFSGIFFPFINPFNKWSVLLQAQSKFNLSMFYDTSKTMFVAAFVILSVFLGRDNLTLIFLAYLFSNTFISLLFYFSTQKYILNKEEDKSWKKSSYKLSLISFMSYVYDYADKILIGILFEPSQLAIYSIAVTSITQLRTGIKMLLRVLMPKLFKADEILLRKILRKYVLKFTLILAFISTVLYFLFPFLINILYSEKYESSIFYAQLFLISVPATGLTMFLQDYLIAFKAETLMIKTKLIFTSFNLALYVVLIPYWGLFGAIISSIIYYHLLAISFLYYSYKK